MTSFVKSIVSRGPHLKQSSSGPAPMDLCEICGKRPKFIEGHTKHPYCSRTCARIAPGSNPEACLRRGCNASGKQAYSGYCSEAHAMKAGSGQAKLCTDCKTEPQASTGELCAACETRSKAHSPRVKEPRMRELDSDGSTFVQVAKQFSAAWRSNENVPTVSKIYEVIQPREVRHKKDSYRRKLESSGRAYELHTYHSAQCICDLGMKGPVFCAFRSCGICPIARSSFAEFAFGAKHNTGRFGDGIYSYRNAAKADYFATSCTSSSYRVMIACTVVGEGGAFPEDETADEDSIFCQSANAISPTYIIMYTKESDGALSAVSEY